MNDLNDSKSWAQGLRYYVELRALDDMNTFRSWPQGFKCYEQLRVADGMNDLGSRELKVLDTINNWGL